LSGGTHHRCWEELDGGVKQKKEKMLASSKGGKGLKGAVAP